MTNGCVCNSSYVNNQPQPPITTPAVIPTSPAVVRKVTKADRFITSVICQFNAGYVGQARLHDISVANSRWLTPKNLSDEGSLPAEKEKQLTFTSVKISHRLKVIIH